MNRHSYFSQVLFSLCVPQLVTIRKTSDRFSQSNQSLRSKAQELLNILDILWVFLLRYGISCFSSRRFLQANQAAQMIPALYLAKSSAGLHSSDKWDLACSLYLNNCWLQELCSSWLVLMNISVSFAAEVVYLTHSGVSARRFDSKSERVWVLDKNSNYNGRGVMKSEETFIYLLLSK